MLVATAAPAGADDDRRAGAGGGRVVDVCSSWARRHGVDARRRGRARRRPAGRRRGCAVCAGERRARRAASRAALSACLDGAWEATRAVAATAFIEAGRARARRLPRARHAGERARRRDARRRGARGPREPRAHAVDRVGALRRHAGDDRARRAHIRRRGGRATAFLGSPAGAYFSGCLLDLRGLAGAGVGLASAGHPAEQPAGDVQRLAVHVVGPRRAEEEDAAGGLLG